jgi:amicyanin
MKLICVLVIVVAILFLTGVSSAAMVQVSISNFKFQPSSVTIQKGDTVTWTNEDTVAHDVKFSDSESPSMNKGDSYSKTFSAPGNYGYICDIHPYMKGTVIVK